jgi:prepilin-type N-terminal cleavage/methylation domain-containing protein
MRRRGFTFYELMVCVVVTTILAVGALPDSRAKMTEEADVAADKFESDLYYARSLSIANPADPAVIKIDKNNNKYWIAKKSNPDVPLTHPVTKQPYVVTFGAGGSSATNHVTIVGLDAGSDQQIQFDGTGSITDESAPVLQLSAGQAKCEIIVSTSNSKCTSTATLSTLSNSTGTMAAAGE